jgi:hypothetical protein
MLVLEGNTITSQEHIEFLTRHGVGKSAEISDRTIYHEEWSQSLGVLVLLTELIIDINGYLLVLPDHLGMVGNWNGNVINLLLYRSRGIISEWNDWEPFLVDREDWIR